MILSCLFLTIINHQSSITNNIVPLTRLQRSLRATFLGMATNTVLSGVKLAAGIAGHSHALVADAVESFADVFSSLIVWRGVIVAAEPADEDHPYGHGKAEPLAAAIVSVTLLFAAGWIAVKAFSEIATPHQVPAPFTLVVLVVVVIVKEFLFRFVRREARVLDNSAVRTDAWHHRSDAITSFAAGIGISVSLVGGKGYEAADDWAAMAAACVIAWNGWRLLRPAFNELMDAAPAGVCVKAGRFLLADGAGSLLYGGGFILLGYLFSNQIQQLAAALAGMAGNAVTLVLGAGDPLYRPQILPAAADSARVAHRADHGLG